jgi:hypothetical protein
MKTEIIVKERVFEPIDILIKLESIQDLDYFIKMLGEAVEYRTTKVLYNQLVEIQKSNQLNK